MNQQRRLALAVRATVAQTRAAQARELAEAMMQKVRAAGDAAGPEDFAHAVFANKEAVRWADEAIAAVLAMTDQWRLDGGAPLLDWLGCSQESFDRAVAEALAGGAP